MQEQIQIFAKAYSDTETIGTANIAELTQGERTKILVFRVGIFILLAVASVFIPILHFILVPGFLIASVFAGLSALRYSGKVVGGEVKCPHCGSIVKLQGGPLSWPLTTICQNCASSLRVLNRSHNDGPT